MAIDLPLNSRYRYTKVVRHNGVETIGMWPGFKWMSEPPFTTIVATTANQGRLDLIAAEYFGAPDYGWAIMYYNNARDLNWPRAGDEVKIPNPSLVLGTDGTQSGR